MDHLKRTCVLTNDAKNPKIRRLGTPFNSDPFSSIFPEGINLIFQHLVLNQILNLSLISSTWAKSVNESSVAMEKMLFVLNAESFKTLQSSQRRYQNIKVFHDEIIVQKRIFLSPILGSIQSLRSLTFDGTFDEECINDFFNKLERKINNFHVDHLTFYGKVSNIDSLLKKFTALKIYKTITLIAFEKETFRQIFNRLRTKELNLKGMNINKLDTQGLLQNHSVNELHLSTTKIDVFSVEVLSGMFSNLKILTIENWDLMKSDAQRDFVESSSSKGLEIRVISNPPVDYFLLSSTPEIHNLIFQHVSGEDLLNVSMVSKNWFNLSKAKISESLQYNLISNDIRAKRAYVNIRTMLDESIISVYKISRFSNIRELSLELEPRSITNLIFLFSFCHFNNLTLLNITCHETSPLDDLRLPTSLKILHLNNFQLRSHNNASAFFQFFAEAKDLNDLQFFDTHGLEKLFFTNIANRIQFKLKGLRLFIDETLSEVSKNFRSFLNTQMNSLDFLGVNQVHIDTIKALAENSNITSLEVRSINNSMRGFKFDKDLKSLTDLQLSMIENFEDAEILLKLSPKLKKFFLFRLSEGSLNFLQNNFSNLEEVRYLKRQKQLSKKVDIKSGLKLISWLKLYDF